MKTYSQKLSETTCILCGAPINEGKQCVYCGSLYIFKKEEVIHDIEKYDEIKLKPYHINLSQSFECTPIIYRGQTIKQLSNFISNEVEIYLPVEEADFIKALFNIQLSSKGRIKKQNLTLRYKDHNVYLEGCVINKYQESNNRITAVIIPDNIIVKLKENDI